MTYKTVADLDDHLLQQLWEAVRRELDEREEAQVHKQLTQWATKGGIEVR